LNQENILITHLSFKDRKMIEDLAKNVGEFCKELLTEVQTLRKENKWTVLIKTTYELKLDNFKYDTQTGIINIGYSSRQPKQIKTLAPALQDEIIQKVKERNVYVELRKKLALHKGVPDVEADMLLKPLIERILSESVEKELDCISVYPFLQTFTNDVIDGPMDWVITTYISGIVMNVDKIQLEKGVFLRKPTVQDAQRFLGNPFSQLDLFKVSAVLEIETTKNVQLGNFSIANIYVMLLLLYGKGSVNVIRTSWKGNSIIRVPWGEMSPEPIHVLSPNEKYTLNEEDKYKLIRFVDRLKSKLPMDENGILIINNHIGISLARYQDAILKNEDVINRISYAIMGLEALFLKSPESGELSMRLSQRVSKLIHAITEGNISDIYDTVGKAYKIRNNFVHGSVQSENTSDSKDVLGKVLTYLRVSIVVFLSIENKEKNQIINLIDSSILDHSVENKLLEMLSNYLELVH
jgi:hypothetical protein